MTELPSPPEPVLPDDLLDLDPVLEAGRKAYRVGYSEGWKAGWKAGLRQAVKPRKKKACETREGQQDS